jgi:hypothetical protein
VIITLSSSDTLKPAVEPPPDFHEAVTEVPPTFDKAIDVGAGGGVVALVQARVATDTLVVTDRFPAASRDATPSV